MGAAEENFARVESILRSEGERRGLRGVMGVAAFEPVRETLLPTQREKLGEIADHAIGDLTDHGSVISIAFAYPAYAIEAIANGSEGRWDIERWQIYARAYARLNAALNDASQKIADAIGGIAIPATVEGGKASKVETVEDYYADRVSHRVAAERSGIGWRGRHELIVNPRYGPAIRLASVLTTIPLTRTPPLQNGCGDCRACLDVCAFLDNKERLTNYREQCRRYLNHLALEDEVCGKCIKACVKSGSHAAEFRL